MNRVLKSMLLAMIVTLIVVPGCSSDSKSLSINPSTLDFKDVNIGEYAELEVTLKNKYGKDLIVKSINTTGSTDFVITSSMTIPVTILKGAEFKFTLKFEPSTDGLIEGSLSILHDQSDNNVLVPMRGAGIACARIDFSETTYDFAKRTINKTHTHDFEISNVGTDDLVISNMSFTGTGSAAYQVTATPLTIVPGSKETITLTFDPTALITYDADLVIEHNGVNENGQFVFPVSGEGRDADPQITLSQTSPWDFGKVVVSKSAVKVCEIENTGLDPLKISSATLQTAAEFTIDAIKDSNGQAINLPYDVAVGGKISIEIKFVPSAKSAFNDVLAIEHDGTNETTPLNVSISGKGIIQGLDFNGDGYGDVIVGARGDDDGGLSSGCAFLFFGSATPPNTIDASAADVKFIGADPGDQLTFVASAGDFNNDGYDDVIIGASYDDDGGTDSGCAFIFFGSASPANTIDASNADVKLVGANAGDRFGLRVCSIGDFNDDDIDDVIVGAYLADDGGTDSGSAYIFFGSNSPANTIDASAANVLLIGGNAGDRFSVRANYAGDFNKDGIDDVIIGADYDNEGGSKAGAAFIFFGSSSSSGTINASAADVKLVGGDADDRFGYAVSYAGDYNGDGYDDVLVGANMDDDAGSSSGSCFLFFGSATPPNKIDAAVANVKFIGEIANDRFGVGLSGAGDFNKDGYDDVIISSSYKDLKGTDSGCAYIFFGSASPSGTVNASTADVKLIGASAGDMFGHNVANAGDFDNDGYNDVIVGAYKDDDGGTDSGCAFIFLGSASPSSSIDAALADVRLVGESSGDLFFTVSAKRILDARYAELLIFGLKHEG